MKKSLEYIQNIQNQKIEKTKDLEFCKEELLSSYQKIFDGIGKDKFPLDFLFDPPTEEVLAEIKRNAKEKRKEELKKLKELAEKEGVKLTTEEKERIVQKIYEKRLSSNLDSMVLEIFDKEIRDLEQEAKKEGLELKLSEGIKSSAEEVYVRMLHGNKLGHTNLRGEMLKIAKEEGVDIDYNKVVKMEFRDLLNIPKERWLDQEKEVEINDESIKVEAHGFFKENENDIEGKFIMVTDPETDEQKIIFDSTMGEHKDIGAKYDVEPIGGGWITMNSKEKTIVVSGESKDFGKEPREKTIQALEEAYPNWEIKKEKEE